MRLTNGCTRAVVATLTRFEVNVVMPSSWSLPESRVNIRLNMPEGIICIPQIIERTVIAFTAISVQLLT